jgi:hypothetical protein
VRAELLAHLLEPVRGGRAPDAQLASRLALASLLKEEEARHLPLAIVQRLLKGRGDQS